jgi:hypothetical protein
MTEYPYFNGIQFGWCGLSASAEFSTSAYTSVVPSASMKNKSFSMEVRRYFMYAEKESKERRGFVSARMSTRQRVSVGFGMTETSAPFNVTPTFGVSYDIKQNEVKPFISIVFGIF